jgi:hypothetical protein
LKATEQHQAAIAAGKPERSIYVEGRGAETFDACVAAFRNGGTLGLVGGLRVLGTSRKAIMARVDVLKSKGIVPYNLETGERDGMKLLDAAIATINGVRGMGLDPRRPRRIGAKGGKAKGMAAAKRRDAILQEAIVRRICTAPELNWKRRAEILGGSPFSESTLRRLYEE